MFVMVSILLIILVTTVFILRFKLFSPVFGNKKYEEAKLLEEQGKYKNACFEYAIAILNSSTFKVDCKKRIKYLWEKYGPFDYKDVLEQMNKDDPACGCNESGYSATMSIIRKITSAIPK